MQSARRGREARLSSRAELTSAMRRVGKPRLAGNENSRNWYVVCLQKKLDSAIRWPLFLENR